MIVTGETETNLREKKIPVVHFTHTDGPPSCTAPQHQTFRLAHRITVVIPWSCNNNNKKKSNNNLLAELFLLPGASFHLRPGIGVMRVRLWDSWEHIIVCPVNWLYFLCPVFQSLARRGGSEAFPPRGDFLPLNHTEQRREPSDSAEPDVTSAQVQPKRRRGRLVHIGVTADAR